MSWRHFEKIRGSVMNRHSKFQYGERAILNKGPWGIIIKIGVKFDSNVKSKRNPSGISYYIDGYEIRDWCYEEELRSATIFRRFFRWVWSKIW